MYKQIIPFYITVVFFAFLKDEALDATKSKLFEYGLFSEAQNIDAIISGLIDSYHGSHKALYDVIRAADMYAKRLIERLTKDKAFSYLLTYPNNRNNQKYEILR